MQENIKNINFLIIHYNTPTLTEYLIKSIYKHHSNIHIYIFDNSNLKPFTYTDDNITIFDKVNTKAEKKEKTAEMMHLAEKYVNDITKEEYVSERPELKFIPEKYTELRFENYDNKWRQLSSEARKIRADLLKGDEINV